MAYEDVANALARAQDRRKSMRRNIMNRTPYNPYQQVSGRSVPYSGAQGLADVGGKMMDAYLMKQQREKEDRLTKQMAEEKADANFGAVQQYFGREGGPSQYRGGGEAAGPPDPGMEADPERAMLEAYGSPYTEKVAEAMAGQLDNQNLLERSKSMRGSYYTVKDVTIDGKTVPIQIDSRNIGNAHFLDGTRLTPSQLSQVATQVGGSLPPPSSAGQPLPVTKPPEITSPKFSPKVQGDLAHVKAKEKAKGEDVAAAEIELPATEARTDETEDLVDKLINHPGLPDVIGVPDNPLVAKGLVPGTEAADFRALHNQITGRTFMEIFPTLKGGGQITEVEGEKGQAAINRMTTATTEKAYKEAAKDFLAEVNRLRETVRIRAGQSPQKAEEREEEKSSNVMRFNSQGEQI